MYLCHHVFDDYLWIREKTIRKSKDVTRQKNQPFRVDLDLGGGDSLSLSDMFSVVGITRATFEGGSAGCLAGELCCEFVPALFSVSFAGELSCATREGGFAGELCCESEPSIFLVVVFEGEACSFSARRLLLLPWTIATKASPGVLPLDILVTAGERRQ